MLSVRNFTKHYGDTLILSVTHLEFRAGVHWIKGENGSGKTTFFRCLTGLLPFQGEIELSGGIRLLQDPIGYRRLINYSEAEPLFPGFLTPKDLVRFIGHSKGATKEQQKHFFERFGIEEYQDKPCSACSSGMVKKLSLALAFLGAPRVVVLDEPLITLDTSSRETLLSIIRQYVEQFQTIFLVSSHQMIDHASLTLDKVLTIENKTIREA